MWAHIRDWPEIKFQLFHSCSFHLVCSSYLTPQWYEKGLKGRTLPLWLVLPQQLLLLLAIGLYRASFPLSKYFCDFLIDSTQENSNCESWDFATRATWLFCIPVPAWLILRCSIPLPQTVGGPFRQNVFRVAPRLNLSHILRQVHIFHCCLWKWILVPNIAFISLPWHL